MHVPRNEGRWPQRLAYFLLGVPAAVALVGLATWHWSNPIVRDIQRLLRTPVVIDESQKYFGIYAHSDHRAYEQQIADVQPRILAWFDHWGSASEN